MGWALFQVPELRFDLHPLFSCTSPSESGEKACADVHPETSSSQRRVRDTILTKNTARKQDGGVARILVGVWLDVLGAGRHARAHHVAWVKKVLSVCVSAWQR